jgi:Ca2+-binding EF-hand superfamily protein
MEDQQLEELVDLTFAQYDTDGNGTLDAEEIRTMFDQLCELKGIPKLRNRQMATLLRKYDTDGDGNLDRDEVLRMLEPITLQSPRKLKSEAG